MYIIKDFFYIKEYDLIRKIKIRVKINHFRNLILILASLGMNYTVIFSKSRKNNSITLNPEKDLEKFRRKGIKNLKITREI